MQELFNEAQFFRSGPRQGGLSGPTFTELQTGLTDLYRLDGMAVPDLADDYPAEMVEEIMNIIWRLKGAPETIHQGMTTYFANRLWSGVTEGYGADLITVDFDTPDYTMLRRMQESVYHFSAAKNYSQLRDLSRALIGEDGKVRTFAAFKEEAHKINSEHINQWLRAEYDMSVANGQMASKWVEFESNADFMPLLQFDAVMDGRTSAICRDLEGVTRPIDDTFWDVYYPPNHWGCRSTVRQLSHGTVTPGEKIITPEKMPAMLKTNMAKNGMAFPKEHPYFTGNPPQLKEQADKLLQDAL